MGQMTAAGICSQKNSALGFTQLLPKPAVGNTRGDRETLPLYAQMGTPSRTQGASLQRLGLLRVSITPNLTLPYPHWPLTCPRDSDGSSAPIWKESSRRENGVDTGL